MHHNVREKQQGLSEDLCVALIRLRYDKQTVSRWALAASQRHALFVQLNRLLLNDKNFNN